MTGRRLLAGLGVAIVLGVGYFLSTRIYFVDTPVPMPPRGEAATNPFYAAQRFAERLGATTTRGHALTLPPPNGIIVLSAWSWNLSTARRERLEAWVEAGGRLVVDDTMADPDRTFERWSGIDRVIDRDALELADEGDPEPEACEPLPVIGTGAASAARPLSLCDSPRFVFLTTAKPMVWGLGTREKAQVIQAPAGRGRVTRIDATLFRERALFDGDHAHILVAATGIRRGDTVHFFSEEDHPSIPALAWREGAPVVLFALAAIGLLLWRNGARHGPLAAAPARARRSLGEQIRGTGTFAAMHGGGDALHAAVTRALDEAARRRIPAYAVLPPRERVTALALLTGIGEDRLADAIHHPLLREPATLRSTIELLESARRRLLSDSSRTTHGTH